MHTLKIRNQTPTPIKLTILTKVLAKETKMREVLPLVLANQTMPYLSIALGVLSLRLYYYY
jgi:hypothetical protein